MKVRPRIERWASGVVNKYSFVVFLCVALFIGAGIGCAEKTGLIFKIKPVDKVVGNELPIRIEIRFESSGDEFRLYKDSIVGMAAALGNGDWLSLQITSPSGKAIEAYGARHPGPKRPFRGDFVDVSPDNAYSEVITVYPNAYRTEITWPEAGTYKIKAKYSYQYDSNWKYGQDLWEGTVESNWIEINVTGRNAED